MTTTTSFRNEQRTLLGDLDGNNYTDPQLDTWRDEEIGALYSKGLFKKGNNRGTEPTVTADENTLVTRYYAFPSLFRRVSEIEFIDAGHTAPPVLTAATAPTGGSLTAGLYLYRIALTDSVGTSFGGRPVAVVVPSGTSTNTVTLSWSPVTVAAVSYAATTGYKVYGRSGTLLLMSTISSNATATFLDNGSITPSGALPTTDSSAKTRDDLVGRSSGFDDLEETTNVRIEEAPSYEGFKVRMFGELEYSAITDAAMKQEVVDVVLFGTSVRAMTSELIARARSSRSIVATRSLDSTEGQIALALQTAMRQQHVALSKALAIQARSTLMR